MPWTIRGSLARTGEVMTERPLSSHLEPLFVAVDQPSVSRGAIKPGRRRSCRCHAVSPWPTESAADFCVVASRRRGIQLNLPPPLVWLGGVVVSALGMRTRRPRFESRVAPLFHWVATLGKLFTQFLSSKEETGVQKGVFGA